LLITRSHHPTSVASCIDIVCDLIVQSSWIAWVFVFYCIY
jgi:hypothetical protein